MKIIQSKKKANIKVSFLNKNKKTKLKYDNFQGKKGQILFVKNTLFVGTNGAKTPDDWREIGYAISKKANSLNAKTLSIEVPKKSDAFIEGLFLGVYSFNKYKSSTKKPKLQTIYLDCKSNIRKTIKLAQIKVNAQFLTRDWVNTTPEEANSDSISKAVKKMFKNSPNVKVTVYGEKELTKFGMRGHLAVNRASRHEAKTVKIEYNPKGKVKKHIILVGKGLTYDSGGLSIKPGVHMTTMKADKAGAMTVWGIIKGLSKIGSSTKVTAYMGMAENMIDGSAYKPDDVITMMNGKKVHIQNTDAEGRIVLFDNLCLAQKENKKFDEIYTFATLTGAAVYQFGNETTAMVGFNDDLKSKIKKHGDKEGEIFMNAEFHKYMLDGVNDSLADLTNTGSAGMGCQKAGLFLTNAITKKNKDKYLHLDIAGPAFVEKPFGTNPAGGTGFGVRTFLRYLTK